MNWKVKKEKPILLVKSTGIKLTGDQYKELAEFLLNFGAKLDYEIEIRVQDFIIDFRTNFSKS